MHLVSEDELRQQYPEAVQAIADGIPDSTFDNHPKIVKLKAEEASVAERIRVCSAPLNAQIAQVSALEAIVQDLTEQQKKALIKFNAKALGDFLSDDTAFSSALEEKAQIQRLAWQLEAATAARLTVQCQIDGGAHRALVDQAIQLQATQQHILRTALLELKLAAASSGQTLKG